MSELPRPDATEALTQALRERILVIDGAMGTLIQGFAPGEAEFRGERFADWELDVKGNSDLLSLTQPDMIRSIHRQYLEAGADIVLTNTFTATSIAQADSGMQDLAQELNEAAARHRVHNVPRRSLRSQALPPCGRGPPWSSWACGRSRGWCGPTRRATPAGRRTPARGCGSATRRSLTG